MALKLVPTEELEEEYPPEENLEDQEAIAEMAVEAGDGITRRGLFKLGLLARAARSARAVDAGALLRPALSRRRLLHTPWRRGTRLVDEDGRPYRATDIEEDNFYTAFPEGAGAEDKEQLPASLVVFRLPPESLRLPPHLEGYDAGRDPRLLADLHPCRLRHHALPHAALPAGRAEARARCPCHYSTFDPATGGTVTFGPAGRDRRSCRFRRLAGLLAREGELQRPGRPVLVGRADAEGAAPSHGAPVTRRAVGWVDQRSASAPLLPHDPRYVFADHRSVLLGEVALYSSSFSS